MSAILEVSEPESENPLAELSNAYELLSNLGKGAFAVVVGARDKHTGKEYAIKVIKKSNMSRERYTNLMLESAILAQLNHINVVKLYKTIETQKTIFLVLDWLRGGTLKQKMEEKQKAGAYFTDVEASIIMKSILIGLDYVHSKNMIHRDLKPDNILFQDPEDLSSVKICDFGLAAQFEENLLANPSSFSDQCGTRIYMAPELWFKRKYSKPVDIWSTGIILFQLLSDGAHPLYKQDLSSSDYQAKLKNPSWKFKSDFNILGHDLFLKLVNSEPDKRYSAGEALMHPFITRDENQRIPLTSYEKRRFFHISLLFQRMIKIIYLINKNEIAPQISLDDEHMIEIDKHNQLSTSLAVLKTPKNFLQNLIKTLENNNHESIVHLMPQRASSNQLEVPKTVTSEEIIRKASIDNTIKNNMNHIPRRTSVSPGKDSKRYRITIYKENKNSDEEKYSNDNSPVKSDSASLKNFEYYDSEDFSEAGSPQAKTHQELEGFRLTLNLVPSDKRKSTEESESPIKIDKRDIVRPQIKSRAALMIPPKRDVKKQIQNTSSSNTSKIVVGKPMDSSPIRRRESADKILGDSSPMRSFRNLISPAKERKGEERGSQSVDRSKRDTSLKRSITSVFDSPNKLPYIGDTKAMNSSKGEGFENNTIFQRSQSLSSKRNSPTNISAKNFMLPNLKFRKK